MEDERHFLLQSLELENFMLHRETRLALGHRPAILITGANGSGKTQVLDALILCMGHHPKRVKKGNLAALVGPHGERARIRLVLRNPRWAGGRALRTGEAELDALIDADELAIETRISPASGVSYKLFAGSNSRTVRQKEVRAILDAVRVKADNKLAFTEEGTVNRFADHSGRNKFELILDATGLLQYREHLLECLATINRAVDEVDPLRRKLHLERDYLQTLERNLEAIRHRQELEDRLAALKVERAWSRVLLHEEELEADRRKVAEKQTERERMADRIASLNETLEQVKGDLERRRQSSAGAKREQVELQSRRGGIEGQVLVRRQAIEQAQARSDKLAARLAELAPPAPEDAPAQAPAFDLALLASPEGRVEWALLDDALRLLEAAEQRGVPLEGPLCSLLVLPRKAEQAARVALGRLAYSLIARTPEALADGRALIEEFALEAEVLLVGDEPADDGPLQGLRRGDAAVAARVDRLLALRHGADIALEDGPLVGGSRGALRDTRWRLAPLAGDGPARETLQATAESARRYLARLDQQADPSQHAELAAYCRAGIEEAAAEIARLEQAIAEAEQEGRALARRAETLDAQVEQALLEEEDQGRALAELRDDLTRREAELENIERVLTLYESDLVARRRRIEEVEVAALEVGPRPAALRELPEVERELDTTAARLDELTVTRVNMEQLEAQREKVAAMEHELAGASEHLQGLRGDLKQKYDDWHTEVKTKIDVISESVKNLLAGIFEGVQVEVANLLDADRASFSIEVKRRGREWRELSQLSGGEKVLVVEALILSLHLLSDSPVHAIDEFTQRLDHESKAYALEMVCRTVEQAGLLATGAYRPQFLLLCPDVLGIEFDEALERIFHRVVLGPARVEETAEAVA